MLVFVRRRALGKTALLKRHLLSRGALSCRRFSLQAVGPEALQRWTLGGVEAAWGCRGHIGAIGWTLVLPLPLDARIWSNSTHGVQCLECYYWEMVMNAWCPLTWAFSPSTRP